MTIITKRAVRALALALTVIALGVTAGVRASDQNTNQDPRPFRPGGPGRFGGPGMPGGPGGPLGMPRMLGPELNLTDAQKEQIKSIAESHREEWTALADRERAAHEALTAAVFGNGADTVDEALIRSKSAELGVVQADVAVASARTRAEVWQLLTPEQQAAAKKMQSELSARRPSFPRGRGPR